MPDGKVSNHLVRDSRPGTLVHLEQAAGEFVLPTATRGEKIRLLFVTAGSGITPVIGMLRNLFPVDRQRRRPPGPQRAVRHHRRARRAQRARLDLPARPAGARRRRAASAWSTRYDDEHGILDVADLEHLVPDLDERTTFACGPAVCSTPSAAHHEERGLPLLTEQFRVTALVAGEGGTVTFDQTGTEVECDGARPILEQAEDAGVLMPSGCRMGICYGCVLPMREGRRPRPAHRRRSPPPYPGRQTGAAS